MLFLQILLIHSSIYSHVLYNAGFSREYLNLIQPQIINKFFDLHLIQVQSPSKPVLYTLPYVSLLEQNIVSLR